VLAERLLVLGVRFRDWASHKRSLFPPIDQIKFPANWLFRNELAISEKSETSVRNFLRAVDVLQAGK
jgi:hypothetical protein